MKIPLGRRGKIVVTTLLALVIITPVALLGAFSTLFRAPYTGIMLPVADGTRLATFVYLPEGDGPFPTLVFRTPYDIPFTPVGGMKGLETDGLSGQEIADQGWPEITEAGYALVIQHPRGRVGSEGQALTTIDREDGLALVEWIQQQSWSNGKIGTMGDSGGAILSFQINAENPEGVMASFTQVGTPNMMKETIFGPGGALKLETFLPWIAEHAVTSDPNHFRAIGKNGLSGTWLRARSALNARAILSSLDKAPHESPAWKPDNLLTYPALSEAIPTWSNILSGGPSGPIADYFDVRSDSRVPTFHVSTWQDVFHNAQVNTFVDWQSQGIPQKLLILQGTHYEIDDPNHWPIQPLLSWFDYWLKGQADALDKIPNVMFPIANADDEWYSSDVWPPLNVEMESWVLGADGVLTADGLQGSTGQDSFIYNPENPVPTVGGRNLLISTGHLDQTPVRGSSRDDVLTYESNLLGEDMVVSGQVFGTLSVSSDRYDTDFTMKLIDLSPTGEATLVADGIVRMRYREPGNQKLMEPGEIYDIKIDLGHIAWRFAKGHRLAVDISSSNFPQWDRNPNSGLPLYTHDEILVAENSIHFGWGSDSAIHLPVLEDLDGLTPLQNFKTGD